MQCTVSTITLVARQNGSNGTDEGRRRLRVRMAPREQRILGEFKDIDVPPEAGRLRPAENRFNGPSGRSLDEHFLEPLGLTRAGAWLCDLVPYSCMNKDQTNAIGRHYG